MIVISNLQHGTLIFICILTAQTLRRSHCCSIIHDAFLFYFEIQRVDPKKDSKLTWCQIVTGRKRSMLDAVQTKSIPDFTSL